MTLQLAKVLLSQVYDLVMLDAAGRTNNHILSEVHPLVVVDNHVASDFVNVIYLAKDRQAHFVVTPDIEVDLLHQRLIIVIVCRKQLLPDGAFLTLHIVVVVLAVTEHVAQNIDREVNILHEANHMVDGEFSRRVSVEVTATILYLSFEIEAAAPPSTFEVQMLKEVSLS